MEFYVCSQKPNWKIRYSWQRVSPHDDRVRGRQFGKSPAFDDETRCEVKEAVCALDITGGAEANGRDSARFGAVSERIVFMNLSERTEWGPAVLFKIKPVSEDDFTRAVSIGDSIFDRESIQPHDDMIK